MRYKKQAMIVAPQPEPTEAGADVLREGGNAVDAGIACALVQGVVDPLMCGIAGFGSCGIYMPGKNFHGYIDAHAPAPLGGRLVTPFTLGLALVYYFVTGDATPVMQALPMTKGRALVLSCWPM